MDKFNFEQLVKKYSLGKELFIKKDLKGAKFYLLEAAKCANKLSSEADNDADKLKFYNLGLDLLSFVKDKCHEKCESCKNENSSNESIDKVESSQIKRLNKKEILFEDVVGLDDVKKEIYYNVIEPIKNPELAKKYKIVPGARILLYGPPGTGKTFIAKAIANEVDAEFFPVNCEDLISKYMGESSKKLEEVFNKAKSYKRSILFFDEIDSIARKRGVSESSIDNEISRFVSTFLTQLDGVEKNQNNLNEMLLVIAATNLPWTIDKAMLRGGRFDTKILVGFPDFEGVSILIKKEFSDIPLEDNVVLKHYVSSFLNISCADIINYCKRIRNLAYRRALITGHVEKVSNDDFINIINKIPKNEIKAIMEPFYNFQNNQE